MVYKLLLNLIGSLGEHVVAAFLDVEKAFDNVWHNGLRFKIFSVRSSH